MHTTTQPRSLLLLNTRLISLQCHIYHQNFKSLQALRRHLDVSHHRTPRLSHVLSPYSFRSRRRSLPARCRPPFHCREDSCKLIFNTTDKRDEHEGKYHDIQRFNESTAAPPLPRTSPEETSRQRMNAAIANAAAGRDHITNPLCPLPQVNTPPNKFSPMFHSHICLIQLNSLSHRHFPSNPTPLPKSKQFHTSSSSTHCQ